MLNIFLLLIIGLPFLVIIAKRMLERQLMRGAERWMLRHPWTTKEVQGSETQRTDLLPFSSCFALFLLITLAAVSGEVAPFLKDIRGSLGKADTFELMAFSTLAQIPAALLLPIILYLHYSGAVSRKIKYELILTCAMSSWQCTGYVYSGLKSWAVIDWQPAIAVGLALGLLFWWLVYMVAQIVVPRFFRRNEDSLFFRRWFYNLQSRAWLFLAFSLLPVLVLYCLTRYHLVRLASRHPILYFRSFSSPKTSSVFSKIVAKAARRYGVVEGLIASRQRGSDLQPTLEITDQARFVAATDDWRAWVGEKLHRASVAIIDMSEATDSVQWELLQSISVLGNARVAIIYNGTIPQVPEGIFRLQYTLDRQGVHKARQSLDDWLSKNLLESNPTRHASLSIDSGPN